jgi:hypothetical protein
VRARHRAIGAAAAVALAVGTTLLLTATSVTAAPSNNPAWEPDSNAVGKVTLLNASGQPVTGGKLSDSPIAASATGSAAGTSGDTKATLYAYEPTTQSPSQWDCHDTLMGPSDSSSSTPTVQGASGDLSLGAFVTECPNTTSDSGHAGYYQLRLVTSGPGHQADPTTNYNAVDIFVNGSSWTLASNVTTGPKHFSSTRIPSVRGVHRVGHKQTCNVGQWIPTPSSFSFKWFKGTSAVRGAARQTFTPNKSFAGKKLSCQVTGRKTGYQTMSVRSKAVKITK